MPDRNLNRLSLGLLALRPEQWSKNLLLAVPCLLAQVWMQPGVPTRLALAFLAFSVAASGTYLINDLIDLEADRGHPAKRERPFASGLLPVAWGWVGGPLLVLAGLAIAFGTSGAGFAWLLLVYVLLSLAYSLELKRRLLLDVLVLAGLYTLRLLAGGAAVGVEVSSWLLAFSLFFFLSLAFAKRLAELELPEVQTQRSPRPYTPIDRSAFRAFGSTSGLLSILVLALYISSDAVRSVYAQPRVLWFLCPLLLYWILRVWFLALRGQLGHDPVLFTIRDRVSYGVAASALAVLYMASG